MVDIIFKPAEGKPSLIIAGTLPGRELIRSQPPRYFSEPGEMLDTVRDTITISAGARSLSLRTPPESLLPGPTTSGFSNPYIRIYAETQAQANARCRESFLSDSGPDSLTVSYEALRLSRSE